MKRTRNVVASRPLTESEEKGVSAKSAAAGRPAVFEEDGDVLALLETVAVAVGNGAAADDGDATTTTVPVTETVTATVVLGV